MVRSRYTIEHMVEDTETVLRQWVEESRTARRSK